MPIATDDSQRMRPRLARPKSSPSELVTKINAGCKEEDPRRSKWRSSKQLDASNQEAIDTQNESNPNGYECLA